MTVLGTSTHQHTPRCSLWTGAQMGRGWPVVGETEFSKCKQARLQHYILLASSCPYTAPGIIACCWYRIVGNFRGRKLAQIGENTIFAEKTFADCSLLLC